MDPESERLSSVWSPLEESWRSFVAVWQSEARRAHVYDEAVVHDVGLAVTLRCVARFDASKGSWWGYLRRCLYLSYLKNRQRLTEELTDYAAPEESRKLDDRDEVQSIMDSLCERDRMILVLRHWGGLTVEEVGDVIGVSKGQACKELKRIYALVRTESQRAP